jgi:hypothetical protein
MPATDTTVSKALSIPNEQSNCLTINFLVRDTPFPFDVKMALESFLTSQAKPSPVFAGFFLAHCCAWRGQPPSLLVITIIPTMPAKSFDFILSAAGLLKSNCL